MLKWILVSAIIFGTVANLHAQYDSIPHNALNRTYLLHVPPSYTGTDPTPLVIAMHGGFGSGPQLEGQSQLSQKADEEGFIVVYPEGVPNLIGIRTWNAGYCCGFAAASDIDDVGFIMALLDTLENQLAIDTNRIYATGMSNGAFMSYRLACEKSERIAAIAPVAGSMVTNDCSPSRGVPVIHLHSYEDSNVPYNGGQGNGFSNHYNPPLDSVLNVWAGFSNCNNLNDTTQFNSEFTQVRWSDCGCENEMQLLISEDGGHSWPGGNGTIIGDPPSEVLDANDLMWAFFQEHSLECPGTSGWTLPEFEQLLVYPNPTSGILYIDTNEVPVSISIYDNAGRFVLDFSRTHRVDLTPVPAGLYNLKIEWGGKISFKKVSVRR